MLVLFILILIAIAYSYLYSLIPLNSPYFWFLWVFLGIISAALTLFIFLFITGKFFRHTKPENKIKHAITRKLLSFALLIMRIKVELIGKENIPKETYVVFANHKSMIDPLMIYMAFHQIMSAVAKKSLFSVPILKDYCVGYGAEPINRENNREASKSIIRSIKLIERGIPMIIFPEGGIKSRDEETMVAMRAGAYKLATKPNAVILPVSIIGNSLISKNAFIRRTDVKIVVHKPIYSTEYNQMNTIELGQKVAGIIDGGINYEKK